MDKEEYFLRSFLLVETTYFDVIHVEKNVCDNLVGTLLNIEGKTKNTTYACLDLQDLKIRKDLHLIEVGN